jgi:uncharacterized membrane protein YeiH
MTSTQFQLPIAFDLIATFFFALSGALIALRKGYDLIGVWVLAFATGAGGMLLRDGIFLQAGPPVVVTDSRYLLAITLAGVVGILFGRNVSQFRTVFALVDALGLGAYAVVGAEKAVSAGIPILGAILVGVTNAVGGGVLRDVLVREEPVLFKPSQFYAVAALVGSVVFLALAVLLKIEASIAAVIAIAASFLVRMLSVWLGWKTGPVVAEREKE